jgi:Mg-chelatase subunit ChlD
MRGEKAPAAASAVAAFIEGIDLNQHRVGIITFGSSSQVWHPINGDPVALRNLPDTFGSSGGTNIAEALDLADRHLEVFVRPNVNEVIVLLSDGRSNRQNAVAEAEEARRRGVQIHTVALGDDADLTLLMAVAGHPSRFHLAAEPEDLEAIYRQIAASISGGGVDVVVEDVLGDDVELVADSIQPQPWSPPGAHMLWRRATLPRVPLTITFRVRPLVVGLVPTNRQAFFDYRDSDGRVRRFDYPIPRVRVIVPTPTFTPTFTPTATPTPTPTPTPTRPAYLPLALREKCVPGQQLVDVALVLDASTSMRERTPSGRSKLEAAQEAAGVFLELLSFDRGDRATVIAFNEQAEVLQALTDSEASLRIALDRIRLGQFTCLVCAVDAAQKELVSARTERNMPVMIVLTDGRSNPRPASEAVLRAAEAKREGTTIYTIGIGGELDFEALSLIASRSDFFYVSSRAEDLKEIYTEIAGEIPCPSEQFWGRRP